MFRPLLALSLIFTFACDPKATTADSAGTDDSADSGDSSDTNALDTNDSTGEDTASDGATLYATHCASCHGAQGEGGSGPELEPQLHHTDEDLVRFILEGRGEMAPIDVTEEEAIAIVAWIRELFTR